MADGKAVADLDFLAIFAADAEQCTDYAFLIGVSSKGVVEDSEDGLHYEIFSSGILTL